MRRIAIGLLALMVSAYAFPQGTPVLGTGPLDVNWSALGNLEWRSGAVRHAMVCGCLALAGLVLLIRGIGDEIDR